MFCAPRPTGGGQNEAGVEIIRAVQRTLVTMVGGWDRDVEKRVMSRTRWIYRTMVITSILSECCTMAMGNPWRCKIIWLV